MTLAGFPHSGTPGSTPTCGSPRLFAACRALLRLSVPRHPPCALVRLTGYPPLATSRDVATGFTRPTVPSDFAWCSRLLDASLHPTSSHTQVFKCNQGWGVLVQWRSTCERFRLCPGGRAYSRLQKGGDPAAGSPTATLLRLRPSHRARLRRLPPASGLGHRLRALPTPMA